MSCGKGWAVSHRAYRIGFICDVGLGCDDGNYRREPTFGREWSAPTRKGFLFILSIKHGNWFYWADRAEAAERAESKESPVLMRI
jgi:hypothetical protein